MPREPRVELGDAWSFRGRVEVLEKLLGLRRVPQWSELMGVGPGPGMRVKVTHMATKKKACL